MTEIFRNDKMFLKVSGFVKKKYLISAFLLPIIILLMNLCILQIIYKDQNIFSSSQILVADLMSQYYPLFNYFRNVLQGNASIFYSFNSGMGGNMYGTFAYYLSSPLNLILFFSNDNNLPLFIEILIFIKIGLCGLSMYIYLNHKKKSFYALLFSSYYALMGFNISYYFNIMWLDVVYLTPLVLYGLDKLIHEKKYGLYILLLSLSIISNFYISYMLCIFIIIYFIYELVINNKKISIIKPFIICSILSILISSFILLPTIYNLNNIVRSPLNTSQYVTNNPFTNFLMSLTKLYMLPQTPNNLLSKYTPNVYFGILPLLFSITFFYSNKSNKEKYITISIIIIFFLSFTFNLPNILWHGLTYPNGYAYRFSYLFSFFMLLISYKSITNNDNLKLHKFLIILFIIFFIGIVQVNDQSNISFNYLNIILTLSFVVIYYILYYFKLKHLIFVFALFELLIHVNNSFYIPASLDYKADYKYYLNTICNIPKDINYRMDSPLIFGAEEAYLCDDFRISGANTINNKDLYKFLYNTGFNVTYSTIRNNDNTNIMMSILGVNYYLNSNEDDSIDSILYDFGYDTYESYYIHQNKYTLPLGFMVNKNYSKFMSNPFYNQNEILKNMSGLDKNVLMPYEIQKQDDIYEVDIKNDKDIYVYVSYPIPENEVYFLELKINDEIYDIDSDNTGIFKIKNQEKLNIKLTLNDQYYKSEPDIYFYYFDEDIFKEHIDILKNNTLKVLKRNKNYLEGEINNKKDGILYLSIPYEKGFKIYVDGKKVNYFKIYNAFIGINLEKGKYEIKIKFVSPYIKEGMILSILGIIFTIIYLKKVKLKDK